MIDDAEDAFLHAKIGLQEKGLIQDVQNFAKRNLIGENRRKKALVQDGLQKGADN